MTDATRVRDDAEAALAERFRKALLIAHADDWSMETCAEAAHICAAAQCEWFFGVRSDWVDPETLCDADD